MIILDVNGAGYGYFIRIPTPGTDSEFILGQRGRPWSR